MVFLLLVLSSTNVSLQGLACACEVEDSNVPQMRAAHQFSLAVEGLAIGCARGAGVVKKGTEWSSRKNCIYT